MNTEVIQYENQIIGAVTLDSSLMIKVGEQLHAEDFAGADQQIAWGSLQKLWREGKPTDVVTLSEASGLAIDLLAEWVRGTYSHDANSVATWVNIVRQKARIHRLTTGLADVLNSAQEKGADADALLGQARDMLMGIESDAVQTKRSANEILKDRIAALDRRMNGEESHIGLTTGLRDLDDKIYGFKPSELILLAARPAMGKSALALQIAQQAACDHGKNVAVFNLEMDEDEMFDRFMVQRGEFPADWFANPQGRQDDIHRIGKAVTSLKTASLTVFDNIFDIEGIVAKCRSLHQQRPLDLVVVDYLQLISSRNAGRFGNRTQEVGEYSRALKMLAMSLGCPVLALSQLNRDVEKRPDKRPLMADLRESGSLEQDANKILMLYRDEIYNEHSDQKGVAEVIVRKHRGGPTGTVFTKANLRMYAFGDLAFSDRQQVQAQEATNDPFA
ncbi:replicative DNA helicase [Halomonas sp. EF61]|uniref:replicative DNA helicase n=1 Tax=Halomonas sp. EF61 TaxID=2950869 RepID=UPI0032DF17DD